MNFGKEILKNAKTPFMFIVIIAAWILFNMWLGKLIWNEVLTEVVPGVKPVEDIWQMLALMVLCGILFSPGF